ncbi:RNA polymerase sigma factor, partial [Saccharothrix sp. MB29]|nr:RNA polymerase sigma factor [Saccharothrix sp. MB29]
MAAAKTTQAAKADAEDTPTATSARMAPAKKRGAKTAAAAKTATRAPRKTAAKAAAPGKVKTGAEGDEPEDLEGGPDGEDLVDDVELIDEPVEEEPAEEETAKPGEGDFVWDEEESEALRQARKDAELTASADSVRA